MLLSTMACIWLCLYLKQRRLLTFNDANDDDDDDFRPMNEHVHPGRRFARKPGLEPRVKRVSRPRWKPYGEKKEVGGREG